MPQVMQDDGPVLVEFYHHPVEDRAASKTAGHYVARDVEYVRITPAGGNLVIEREVSDKDRQRFDRQYKAWLDGVEPPEDGTPLKEWPPISPGQLINMSQINVRTVEALAKCPDGPLQHAGMGAYALREKAQKWLAGSESQGKLVEEIDTLRREVEAMRERNEQLEEQVAAMKPRRGRPPKVREEATA